VIKRYSILTLLLFTYALVLAHSIIPHHHHDDEDETAELLSVGDNETDHHHTGDTDDDGSLAHAFENYLHFSSVGDVYQQSELKVNYNTVATVYLVASYHLIIQPVERSLPALRVFDDRVLLPSCCLFSKGLRAPPLV